MLLLNQLHWMNMVIKESLLSFQIFQMVNSSQRTVRIKWNVCMHLEQCLEHSIYSTNLHFLTIVVPSTMFLKYLLFPIAIDNYMI